MKIGIIGIGAIGSVLSLALQDSNDLYYFNRSKRDKLIVEHNGIIENREITLSDFDTKERLDWLLICLKEYHIQKAIPSILKLIHSEIRLAVIQNGLDLKGPYMDYLEEENILECIVDCPTQIIPDGGFLHYSTPKILTATNKNLKVFKSLFQHSKIEIDVASDFHTEKWKKVIESSSLGGILTVMSDTCKVFNDSETLELYRKIVAEGIEVAIADGAEIRSDFKDILISKVLQYPESKGSSMLTDRVNGRPIEWKAKNGIISSIGKLKGIRTDLNDFVCVLLSRTNISACVGLVGTLNL